MLDRSKGSWVAWVSFAAATGLLVALASCGSDSPSTSDEPAASDQPSGSDAPGAGDLAGTSWDLASTTVAGKEVAAVGTPALAFDADGNNIEAVCHRPA